MTDVAISGLLHIEGNACPANFTPSTWVVEASVDPQDLGALTDPEREFAVRFESALRDGGSINGFARCVAQEGNVQYRLYLKSIVDHD